jgi:hypothetical protein
MEMNGLVRTKNCGDFSESNGAYLGLRDHLCVMIWYGEGNMRLRNEQRQRNIAEK